jgi:hypothetical protein
MLTSKDEAVCVATVVFWPIFEWCPTTLRTTKKEIIIPGGMQILYMHVAGALQAPFRAHVHQQHNCWDLLLARPAGDVINWARAARAHTQSSQRLQLA